MPKKPDISCSDCGLLNCYRHDKRFPDFCLTEEADPKVVGKISRVIAAGLGTPSSPARRRRSKASITAN